MASPVKKIAELENKFVNVAVEGIVTGKSLKTPMKNKTGCYFNFFLIDAEDNKLRCVAFNEVADKLYESVENNTSVRVDGVNIKESTYYDKSTLQAILQPHTKIISLVTPVKQNVIFTKIKDIKPNQEVLNVRGLLRNVKMSERLLKVTNTTKKVYLATLEDESGLIDVTFWDHHEIAKKYVIEENEEEQLFYVKICYCTSREFRQGITLNVNSNTEISEWIDGKITRSDYVVQVNMSQRSDVSSNTSITLQVLLESSRNELHLFEVEEEQRKIKKQRLLDSIAYYESRL